MLSWLRTRRKARPPDAGQRAADKALANENKKLGAVTRESRTIREEARELKRLGEQNDFAGKLRRAMGGAG